MKKLFALFLALVAVLITVTSCGGGTKKCEHIDADDNLKCDLCDEAYDDGEDLPKPYEFKTPITD